VSQFASLNCIGSNDFIAAMVEFLSIVAFAAAVDAFYSLFDGLLFFVIPIVVGVLSYALCRVTGLRAFVRVSHARRTDWRACVR
jgi:hypothetical protein